MQFEDFLTEQIIGAGIEVHRHLGPGHLESLYHECLCHELSLRGIHFEKEVWFNVQYKDLKAKYRYRADLVVGRKVLVEVKALEKVPEVAYAQVLTYLKLANLQLGLLLNFNVPRLKESGIKRVANHWRPYSETLGSLFLLPSLSVLSASASSVALRSHRPHRPRSTARSAPCSPAGARDSGRSR